MTWPWTSLLCLRFPMQMYWTFCACGNFKARRTYAWCFVQSLSTTFEFQRPTQSLPWNVSLYAIQKDTLQAQSDILGLAISAAGRVCVTAATLQHPAVFGLFARWLEDNMPLTFAQSFPFTTITMTHGHRPPFQFFVSNHECLM